MKDRDARESIASLKEGLALTNERLAYADGKIDQLKTDFENHIKRLEESAKPICQACGQKIQDGFKAGDLETVAVSVPQTKKTVRK